MAKTRRKNAHWLDHWHDVSGQYADTPSRAGHYYNFGFQPTELPKDWPFAPSKTMTNEMVKFLLEPIYQFDPFDVNRMTVERRAR